MRKRGLIYKIFQKLSRGMSPGVERAEKARLGREGKSRKKMTPAKGVRHF